MEWAILNCELVPHSKVERPSGIACDCMVQKFAQWHYVFFGVIVVHVDHSSERWEWRYTLTTGKSTIAR